MQKQKIDYKINKNKNKINNIKKRNKIQLKNIIIILISFCITFISIYYIFNYFIENNHLQNKDYTLKSNIIFINKYKKSNEKTSSLHSVFLLSINKSSTVLSYYPKTISLDNKNSIDYFYKNFGARGLTDQFESFKIKPLRYAVIDINLYLKLNEKLKSIIIHHNKSLSKIPININNYLSSQYLYHLNKKQLTKYLQINKPPNNLQEHSKRWTYSILSLIKKSDKIINLLKNDSQLRNYITDYNLPQKLIKKWLNKFKEINSLKFYIYPYSYRKQSNITKLNPSIKRYKVFIDLIAYYYRTNNGFTSLDYIDIITKHGLILLNEKIKLKLVNCTNKTIKDKDALIRFLSQFKINTFFEDKKNIENYCRKNLKKSYIINTSNNLILSLYLKQILKINTIYNIFEKTNKKNKFIILIGNDFLKMSLKNK